MMGIMENANINEVLYRKTMTYLRESSGIICL